MTLVKDSRKYACNSVNLGPLQNDTTTERLGIELISDEWRCKIVNYYVPPIWEHHAGETRRQNFNANDALIDNNNTVLLGDFNAHNEDWDTYVEPDTLGQDIANWISDTSAQMGNDGSHTYLSSNRAKKSAPDISLSVGLNISNWKTLPSLGTNHLPISFEIEQDPLYMDLTQFENEEETETLKYAWDKANWSKFSEDVDKYLQENKPKNGTAHGKIKWWIAALKYGAKMIPRGSRKDQKPFWSHVLYKC